MSLTIESVSLGRLEMDSLSGTYGSVLTKWWSSGSMFREVSLVSIAHTKFALRVEQPARIISFNGADQRTGRKKERRSGSAYLVYLRPKVVRIYQ